MHEVILFHKLRMSAFIKNYLNDGDLDNSLQQIEQMSQERTDFLNEFIEPYEELQKLNLMNVAQAYGIMTGANLYPPTVEGGLVFVNHLYSELKEIAQKYRTTQE
ncbi:MAG: hypothetical protein OHK0017_06360 [Patescibacteria group bacterium]